MNCPYCEKALKLEGEFYSSDVELDIDTVMGGVEITFSCAECGTEFGEYVFELGQDMTDFTKQHEDEENGGTGDHELSVTLSDESFDEHTDNKGIIYPGATATIKVSCICGGAVEYLWSDYADPDDIIKELL